MSDSFRPKISRRALTRAERRRADVAGRARAASGRRQRRGRLLIGGVIVRSSQSSGGVLALSGGGGGGSNPRPRPRPRAASDHEQDNEPAKGRHAASNVHTNLGVMPMRTATTKGGRHRRLRRSRTPAMPINDARAPRRSTTSRARSSCSTSTRTGCTSTSRPGPTASTGWIKAADVNISDPISGRSR